MRCAQYRRQTDLMLDGALDRASAARLAPHLESCSRCRSYRDEGLRLRQLVSSAPLPPFPVWLHNRIMDQCKAHEAQRAGFRRRARLQLVPAAMAVMLSLFLGSLVGKNAFTTQNLTDSATNQTSYELSFGENTLVDSDYYNGGDNE